MGVNLLSPLRGFELILSRVPTARAVGYGYSADYVGSAHMTRLFFADLVG